MFPTTRFRDEGDVYDKEGQTGGLDNVTQRWGGVKNLGGATQSGQVGLNIMDEMHLVRMLSLSLHTLATATNNAELIITTTGTSGYFSKPIAHNAHIRVSRG